MAAIFETTAASGEMEKLTWRSTASREQPATTGEEERALSSTMSMFPSESRANFGDAVIVKRPFN